MTNVKGSRHTQDYLRLLAFFRILIAPNVILAAGVFPIVWIECLRPTKWFSNLGEVSDVLRVLIVQREEPVVRTCASMANGCHEKPILSRQLHT